MSSRRIFIYRYYSNRQLLIVSGIFIWGFFAYRQAYMNKSVSSGSYSDEIQAGNNHNKNTDNAIVAGKVEDSTGYEKNVAPQFPVGYTRLLKKEITENVRPADKDGSGHDSKIAFATFSMVSDSSLQNLTGGMVNVTKGDGIFQTKDLGNGHKIIAIPFDPDKIPIGYNAGDIRIFWFNTTVKNWVQLKRDSIDLTGNTVFSTSTKDGDYINAIMKVPEAPETQGYAPTTLSDLKVGDPASMVQIIRPPAANNQGSANLSYQIEAPPGRHGIQPAISLAYNSDAGRSWLGEGWNINGISSITVETRWGVPQYSTQQETETYLLDGQMLAFMHNNEAKTVNRFLNVNRPDITINDTAVFYLRKESSFKKIQRVGDSPQNYFWIITDKQGTKYFYGGRGSFDLKCVLRNEGGATKNIAEWKLCRVEDVFGNWMSIDYDMVSVAIPGSTVEKAYSIYPKEIRYTGWTDLKNPENRRAPNYKVVFEHYSKKNKNSCVVNARYGFLTTNTDSLVSISVINDYLTQAVNPPKTIRTYKLFYRTGAFQAVLLDSIAQYGLDGKKFFNGQKFSYYNEDQNEKYYETPVAWTLPNDGLKGSNSFPFVSNNSTAIGGSESSNTGYSMYFGLGLLGNPGSKNMTVGAQFGSNSSTSNGINTLVDISGDGLADKVFVKNNAIAYHKNNGHGFDSDLITITGIRQFSEDVSRTTSHGYQGLFGAFSIGTDNSKTESTTSTYFNDVNADGLLDIVSNNVVYFNCGYIGGNAQQFNILSSQTPVALNSANGISGFNFVIPQGKKDSLENDNPLHEVVKVWEAPLDGNITIDAPVKLIEPNPEQKKTKEYQLVDGIKVSIQKGNNTILDSASIRKTDYLPKLTTSHSTPIRKGEKIYFRLQSGTRSNANGSFDDVIWQPEITYSSYNSSLFQSDVYGQDIYKYKAKNDYLLSNSTGFVIDSGVSKISFSGNFKKGQTADTVLISLLQYKRVEILKPNGSLDSVKYLFEDSVYSKRFLPGEIYNSNLTVSDKSVTTDGRVFKFEIKSRSNYDLKKIGWKPVVAYNLRYKKNCMQPDGSITTCNPVQYYTDPKLVYAVPYHIFSDSLSLAGQYWKVPDTAEYTILSFLSFNDTLGQRNRPLFGPHKGLLFSVRNNSGILSAVDVPYFNSKTTTGLVETKVKLNKGDKIFSNYETFDTLLTNKISDAFFELKSEARNVAVTLGATEILTGQNMDIQSNSKFSIRPEITLENNKTKGSFFLKIFKSPNVLMDSIKVVYDSNKVYLPELPLSLRFNAGEKVLLKIKTSDTVLANNIKTAKFYCNQQVPSFLWSKRKDEKFGPMYRGWGQFVYSGMAGRAQRPIIESDLILKTSDGIAVKNNVESVVNQLRAQDAKANVSISAVDDLSPMRAIFSMMSPYADVTKSRWQGSADDIFATEDTISSSRLGLDDVNIENPFAVATISSASDHSFAYGIKKIVYSQTDSKFIGVGPATGSESHTTSQLISDFMDLNGDRFPDIVGPGQIQFTNALGSLETAATNTKGIHQSKSDSKGIGFGGGFYQASGSFTLRTGSNGASGKTISNNAVSNNTTVNASVNIGASGSGNDGSEETLTTWLDVNGDGLPDKIYRGNTFLNLGNGNFTSVINFKTGAITSGKNMSISPGISLGLNFDNQSYTAGIGMSLGNTRPDFSLQDYNGDGLLDSISIDRNGIVNVGVNNGFGFLPAVKFTDIGIAKTELQNDVNATLPIGRLPSVPSFGGLPNPINDWIDLDRTKFNGSAGQSLGGSFTFGFNVWIPFTPLIRFVFNPAINKSNGLSKSYRQFADINGDGFPDFLYSTNESNVMVSLSMLGKTNKLKKITNPLGGSFSIDYQHTVATFDHPGGKWVMGSVTIDDGDPTDRTSKTSGFDSKKEFEYSSGKYDRYEREFLGFGKVETKDLNFDGSVYRKNVQVFDIANYYVSGNLLSDIVTDKDNNIFTKTVNTYYLYILKPNRNDYSSRGETSNIDIQRNRFTGICYSPVKKNENYNFEGTRDSVFLNQSLYEYNFTGAVTNFKYKEGGKVTSANFDYETEVHYVNPRSSRYVLDCPSSMVVKKGAVTYRESLSKYTTEGKPKDIYKRVDATLYDTTHIQYDPLGNIENRKLQNGLSFTYSYDADRTYSYITKVNNDTYSYSSETWYNYYFGLPIRTKDINDNNINYELDSFGRITRVLGPKECNNDINASDCKNKFTIKISYSVSDKLAATKPTSLVTHFDVGNAQDGVQTINIIDGFKRSVQIKKTASITDASGNANQKANWIVGGRVIYDAVGRNIQIYYPDLDSTANGLGYLTRANVRVKPTRLEYDVLDRVKKKTLPDDNIEFTSAYTLDNNLSLATSTYNNDAVNGGNQIRKTYTNGTGLKAADVLYNPSGAEIKTGYQYDPVHQLKTVIDARQNKIIYQYDYVGNKTEINHPDAGVTKFVYDAAGRLLKKTTAKNETISYSHYHDRLTAIEYPNHHENDVKYVYSNDISNINGRGKLIYQEDASGSQAYEYGKLGEISKTTRTIIAPFTKTAYTFITAYDYDTWNRIQSITYPDKETVNYIYTKSGLLKQITGTRDNNTKLPAKYRSFNYVSKIGYDEFEQRIYFEYGNGVKTTYKYQEDRRRLAELNVTGIAANSPFFQTFNSKYSYDNQNNVKQNSIGEKISTSLTLASMTHNYIYDNLNRVDSAWGAWINGPENATYQLAMDYDDLYNVAGKRLQLKSNNANYGNIYYNDNFHYQSGSPHQLTKLIESSSINGDPNYAEQNTESYIYDKNGNNTLKSTADKSGNDGIHQRKILWDEENRITSISVNGYVSSYVYDADGNRTVKLSTENEGVFVNGKFAANHTTPATYYLYANPYFSMRNGSGLYTKHIYIGTQRIVSQVENENCFDDQNVTPAKASIAAQCPPGNNNCNQTVGLEERRKRVNARLNADYDGFELPHTLLADRVFETKDAINSTSDIVNPFVNANGAIEQLPKVSGAAQLYDYFYHSNLIGSASFITDESSKVVQYLEYLPYGETFMEQRQSYSSQFTFSGKEQDQETGLYYFGARYYDPHTYQWLGVDPLAEKNYGKSPYNYCLNNPITMADPDGRFAFVPVILIGAEVVSFAISSYDAYKTYNNPNATTTEKTLAYGGLGLSLIAPAVKGASYLGVLGKEANVLSKEASVINSVNQSSNKLDFGASLSKQLASESQMASEGFEIAGGNSGKFLKQADRLSETYGGQTRDWTKKTSDVFNAKDGSHIETHWFENIKTGQKVEQKTIINPDVQ
jgi:RHS repeat-associated protein